MADQVKVTRKLSGWKSLYGDAGRLLQGSMPAEDFARMRAEFLADERARMRQVMRERRARIKAQDAERLQAAHGRLPNYPDNVLDVIERWVNAHIEPDSTELLGNVADHIRQYAFAACADNYRCITARGIGQYLRASGFRVVRWADGMRVRGIWLKRQSNQSK